MNSSKKKKKKTTTKMFLFHLILMTSFVINSKSLMITTSPTNFEIFQHKISTSHFKNILKHKQWLYITANNYVFKLNATNITDVSENTTNSTSFKQRFIPPTHQNDNNSSINSIEHLSIRDSFNDLIICGTNLGRLFLKL
jgi:hypothetical protein